MVALLGLSFGLGGTMLIHRSFKTSLSSTIDSDLQNYESIQSTLLIAVDTNSVSSYIDMSNIINQLSAQGNSNRKNIILRNGNEESEPFKTIKREGPVKPVPFIIAAWKDFLTA